MRKMQKNIQGELQELICNKCGKKMKLHNGFPAEGVCPVTVRWEYFSEKDGEIHHFDLCEECYDNFVKGFAVPVEVTQNTELIL